MREWRTLVVVVVAFLLMEGISWWATKVSESDNQPAPPVPGLLSPPVEGRGETVTTNTDQEVSSETVETTTSPPAAQSGAYDSGSFPPPSVEVVNGRVERTIHMGVRQWEWDPVTLTAKRGELVRLIVHNADVQHGLVIPALDVEADIPPDGAVIEFTASKTGTFEFFCSVYCGEGHVEMRGELVVEE